MYVPKNTADCCIFVRACFILKINKMNIDEHIKILGNKWVLFA